MEAMETIPPQTLLRPRRRWLLMTSLGLLILASGMVLGGILTAHVLWNRLVYNLQHPENVPALAARHLAWRLGLDKQQTGELRSILDAHFNHVRKIRVEFRPRVEGELEQLRSDISAILRPDQVQRWQTSFDNLRAKLQPPPP